MLLLQTRYNEPFLNEDPAHCHSLPPVGRGAGWCVGAVSSLVDPWRGTPRRQTTQAGLAYRRPTRSLLRCPPQQRPSAATFHGPANFQAVAPTGRSWRYHLAKCVHAANDSPPERAGPPPPSPFDLRPEPLPTPHGLRAHPSLRGCFRWSASVFVADRLLFGLIAEAPRERFWSSGSTMELGNGGIRARVW